MKTKMTGFSLLAPLLLMLFSTTALASTNPQTGDAVKLGLIVGVLGLSLVGIIIFVVLQIKKNR